MELAADLTVRNGVCCGNRHGNSCMRLHHRFRWCRGIPRLSSGASTSFKKEPQRADRCGRNSRRKAYPQQRLYRWRGTDTAGHPPVDLGRSRVGPVSYFLDARLHVVHFEADWLDMGRAIMLTVYRVPKLTPRA